MSDLTPTLAAARAALPPEGANPPWGGPTVDWVAPMLATACAALPPEGANPLWGGPAVDWVATALVVELAAAWWCWLISSNRATRAISAR